MATNEVEDLCRRLQTFQLQLRVILDRNNDVLGHLEQIEDWLTTMDEGMVNKDTVRRNLQACRMSSHQVQEIVETQCVSLDEQIKELARHADDDIYGDLNRIPDSTMSSVKQKIMSQLDHNVTLQEDKAELEERLAEKLQELDQTNHLNYSLREDVEESREKMRSVLERLDQTASQAEERLDSLAKETKKAQKMSEAYQRLYETEKQKVEQYEKDQEVDVNPSPNRQTGTPSFRKLSPTVKRTRASSTPYLFQSPTLRARTAERVKPQEIDTKYLCLVDENKNLHLEIRRLRDENSYLMKRSNNSKRDVDLIQKFISTCQTQRNELQTRLKREQDEHHKLVSTMNKQASNWISEKKMMRGPESRSKTFNKISSSRKLNLHLLRLNEDKPRDIPVHSW